MHETPRLRLYFFGYPRAEYQGKSVSLRARKGWGLLAYAILTRIEHSRESISALLWPESSPEGASASLRTLLWHIRQTPLSPCIEATRATLRWNPTIPVWVDVLAFRERASRTAADAGWPELREAIRLYRAPLLAGLTLDASCQFDDWLQLETSALQSDLAAACDQLAAADHADPEMARVLSAARLWVGEASDSAVAPHVKVPPFDVTRGLRGCRPDVSSPRLVRGAPRFRTPLVGRTLELAAIDDALRDPEARLITVSGPGGSGKSHLAAAAASRNAQHFAEGAYFVSLSHVDCARDFVLALGDALDMPLYHAVPAAGARDSLPEDALDTLRARSALLVLDNMEQLAGTFRWIEALVGQPGPLRVLVTSRHHLELSRERVIALSGLPWPDEDASDDATSESESVRLFVLLARQALPGFSPTAAELRSVGRICRALQGIPLAIELAASWIRSVSCAEIAASVESALADLETTHRDVPSRHRSLRAVFLQSWMRLSRSERAMFRRLAAFAGPFSAEAALRIADLSPAALASLVRRSLVWRLPDGRYALLRVLRALLAERLRASGSEYDRIHRRHAAFYLDSLTCRARDLKTARQKSAADEIGRMFENIESAWRFAASACMFGSLISASRGLFTFLQLRNRFVDGVDLFRTLRRAGAQSRSPKRAPARRLGRLFEGWFLVFGDEPAALSLLREAHRESARRAMDDEAALAAVLTAFVECGTRSNVTVTREEIDRCACHFASREDDDGEALALEAAGVLIAADDPKDALVAFEECGRRRRGMGDQWGVASILTHMGVQLICLGRYKQAEGRLREALAIHQLLAEDPFDEMGIWSELARVSRLTGRMEEARHRYKAAYDLARTIGAQVARGSTAESLSRISHAMGDMASAREYAREAIALYSESGDAKRLARCLEFARTSGGALGPELPH